VSEKDQRRLAHWRATGEPLDVELVSREDAVTTAVVYRKSLTRHERSWRALVGLGTCWLLAIATVLVPIAHFVLVPGFLIAGPIVAWMRYGKETLVMGGLGTCPRCKAPVRVRPAAEDWPLSAACDACRAIVQVRKADDA